MKKLALTLLLLTTLNSCKDETSKKSTDSKKSSSLIENFNCSTFFKKGDYSSLCFTDLKQPKYINRGCIFEFSVKGDKHIQDLKVQFVRKKSLYLAEMHYNLNRNNSKKGSIKEISSVGDAAFFNVHSTDLKSLSRSNKDLYVRYNNITFVIFASYQSNTDTPCFYDDKALVNLAEKIIENL